jgi:hypothetical protein
LTLAPRVEAGTQARSWPLGAKLTPRDKGSMDRSLLSKT